MVRGIVGSLLAALVLTGPAWGQSGLRWRWQKDQALVYRSEQTTQAIDVMGETRIETGSRLQLTKRWQVLDVDAQGVATLQLKLLTLKMETTTPGGEVLTFDSANPKAGTEGLREKMASFVGPVLAVLRVDARGRVVEVKESNFGPASKYENEPPFIGVLPETMPRQDHTWERPYKITLAPPQGTGEEFAAVQKYRLKDSTNETITLTLSTELKTQPPIVADRVPLLQLLPEGEWTFDYRKGRLIRAQLKVDRSLQNHRGEGSSHHFRSQSAEWLVEE